MSDPRLKDHVRDVSTKDLPKAAKKTVILLSYPDDEGVRNNSGRPGAARGPEVAMRYLMKMVYQPKKTPMLLRAMDDFPLRHSLEERHEWSYLRAKYLLQKGYRVISFGGGHDYGFPDGRAFFESFKSGTLLNVDAHLDVRSEIPGRITSGTPYYRLKEKFPKAKIVEWGIQEQTNAIAHLEYAKKKNIKIVSWTQKAPKVSGTTALSFCLDAFQGIRGVSAPAVVGINPADGVHLIKAAAKKSPSLGLYEMAPELDPGHEDSCRLAAVFAYHFIHA